MKIKWDEVGKRLYETGVDHGVLFPMGEDNAYGKGVPWYGLSAVNESPSGGEPNAVWADNIKYLNLMSAEDFGATIEAYTYCLPKYSAKAGSTGSNTTTPPSNGSASKPASAKKASEAARSFDKTLAGTYVVTANVGLHIRNGAGTGKASLAVLPKGTKVANYGYYTLAGNIKWLYVQVTYKGVTYTGFCSSQYLKK